MKEQKVFCIGFQKTGTTSLEAALTRLGYRVASVFGKDCSLVELTAGFKARGLEIAAGYDAVQDMPWPLMFRELDAAFPNARFILSWRETTSWYRSITRHFGSNPSVIQQLTYGEDAAFPQGHEARYRAVYEAHNAAVRAHFNNRLGDLLEFSLERGDGWPELARFLDIGSAPQGPFIHANSGQDRAGILRRARKGIARISASIG